MPESWFQPQTIYALTAGILLGFLILATIRRPRPEKKQQPPKNLQLELQSLEKRLSEEQQKTTRAIAETEKQKEIANIAASIGDEQANKLTLFAKIADEFRTPVTLTIGPLENALEGRYGKVDPRVRKALEITLRNARQLLRLINRFHDISKLQAGTMELKPRKKNLVRFLKQILASFESYTEKRGIHLEFQADADEIAAYIDVEKMEEVFYHLISNALRFTSKGGSVTLQISEGGSSPNMEEIIDIRVNDTGKGISPEELSKLFDLLRQAREPSSDRHTGPRIGLTLVHDLITLHGGTIQVKSAPGKGSEFRILLRKGKAHFVNVEVQEGEDVIEEEAWEASERAAMEIAALEEKKKAEEQTSATRNADQEISPDADKILIVEDNPDIRELLKDCLKGHYRITEAADGKEALEKIYELAPDLVISDVLMPGMDGLDLCRTLKTDQSLHHIPVILLTAKGSEVMRIQGLEAGADAYIIKPFTPAELLESIRSFSKQR